MSMSQIAASMNAVTGTVNRTVESGVFKNYEETEISVVDTPPNPNEVENGWYLDEVAPSINDIEWEDKFVNPNDFVVEDEFVTYLPNLNIRGNSKSFQFKSALKDFRVEKINLIENSASIGNNKVSNPLIPERLAIIKDCRKLKNEIEDHLKRYKTFMKGKTSINKQDYINHCEEKIRELAQTITKMQSIMHT